MIDRCALLVTPKQPFLEWLAHLPDPNETQDAIDDERTVYLLPEYGHNDEQEALLEQCAGLIFEIELEAWWTERNQWPANRSLPAFREWFTVHFHSVVAGHVPPPWLTASLARNTGATGGGGCANLDVHQGRRSGDYLHALDDAVRTHPPVAFTAASRHPDLLGWNTQSQQVSAARP